VSKRDTKTIGVIGAARVLNTSENTVRRWVDTGQLNCTRDYAGRRVFSIADLRAYDERRAARA